MHLSGLLNACFFMISLIICDNLLVLINSGHWISYSIHSNYFSLITHELITHHVKLLWALASNGTIKCTLIWAWILVFLFHPHIWGLQGIIWDMYLWSSVQNTMSQISFSSSFSQFMIKRVHLIVPVFDFLLQKKLWTKQESKYLCVGTELSIIHHIY